jgi:hypothetical protein
MSLIKTGPAPIIIVKFGNTNVIGQCYLSFQAEPLDSPAIPLGEFNTNTAINQLTLNPQDLLSPPANNIKDLIGCYVGWSVFFYSLVGVQPSFKFSLNIQQSGSNLITPIVVTETSDDVVAASVPGENNKLVFSFGNFRKIV